MGKVRKIGYKILAQLVPRSQGICPLCGEEIDLEGIKQYVHWRQNRKARGVIKRRRKTVDVNIDHIHPIEHGGGNEIQNLQLVHPYCNSLKSDRLGIPRYWNRSKLK
jgi:5-methylcytosine-specific restriction endonuclease McrA